MTSLSKSILWDKMREYYSKMGPLVWRDEIVPLHITSNKFIADVYVSMIIAQIKDNILQGWLEPAQPFYILEVGAGHGKFSYYVLRSLMEALDINQMPRTLIRYLITDISQKNLDSCSQHPSLKPFIAEGILDVACYHAERDHAVYLQHQNITLAPGSMENPLFIICNYLFDTLSHDAFQIIDKILHEIRIQFYDKNKKNTASSNSKPKNKFKMLAGLRYNFHRVKVGSEYYEDSVLNEILKEYSNSIPNAAFLIPVGGIACVANISKLTKKHHCLLMADKGISDVRLFDEEGEPDLAEHGSISLMVNIDAISKYFKKKGGYSLLMSNKNTDFQVAFFCSGRDSAFPNTHYNFRQHVEYFSPEDLFALCYDEDERRSKKKNIDQLIAILQLSRWDPAIFSDLNDWIVEKVGEISLEQEITLLQGLDLVKDYFFKLEDSQDVFFEVGRLYYALGCFENALDAFQRSMQFFNRTLALDYNVALCQWELGNWLALEKQLKSLLKRWPHSKKALTLQNDLKKMKKKKTGSHGPVDSSLG